MTKLRRRSPKRVTIKDVAQVAGVSVTTVSNVLNDRTEAMTGETLLRIQEAIRSLSYRPSMVARSLVTQHTATIGLIISEIETPLFLQALNFIEPTARSAGYSILLCNACTPDDEQQAVNLLLEKQVDGIIFLSTSVRWDDSYLVQLPPEAPPIVLINRAAVYERFDSINWDDAAGLAAVVEYLAQLGHRHIAHLRGPLNRYSAEERLRGYRLGLERCGLEYREAYVRLADYTASPETWQQSTLELLALSPPPTAIIAANDTVAAGVMRTVQSMGLRLPQAMSVTGVDNQPFGTYLNPALTTLQLPVIEAGEQSIDMLLARMAGQRAGSEHLMLSCPLIIRESSGAPPVRQGSQAPWSSDGSRE